MTQTLNVEVGADHIANFLKTPRAGLVELVWNALDASATSVDIVVETNSLKGIDEVVIVDNGEGMDANAAINAFKNFGASWKRNTVKNSAGRPLHGEHGRGRFTAFALGDSVTWETVAGEDEDERRKVVIQGDKHNLKQFEVADPVPTTMPVGTRVTARVITEKARKDLVRPGVREDLTVWLAPYLERFPEVTVRYRGEALSPASIQERTKVIPLPTEDGEHDADLRIIEWKAKIKKSQMFLCDAEGNSIEEANVGTQPKVPFAYTAYVRWQGFREMSHDIVLADMPTSPAAPILTAARQALNGYLKTRVAEKEQEVIREWADAKIYPYDDEPRTSTEVAERQTFNVVALSAAPVINEAPPTSRRFMLNLIKTALEASPGALQEVLTEVLVLPPERIEELKQLLHRTTLANVIESSKRITGRLDFLHGLNALIFDADTRKATLERRQLHRILALETWIFGEMWALTGDDDRLTQVLHAHLGRLGDNVEALGGQPVLREDGSDGIPDLVLSRTLVSNEERFRHLVVELKRPSHRLTLEDLQQLQSYAGAITRDERFDQPNVHWDFWLVGNATTDDVNGQRDQVNMPFGIVTQNKKYTIWVKQWSEVIGAAQKRLNFVRESLDVSATRDTGLNYLRERHEHYLPSTLVEKAVPPTATDSDPA